MFAALEIKNLFSDLLEKGGPMIWPLLACSILSLTIILDRLFFWWMDSRRCNQGHRDELMEVKGKSNLLDLVKDANSQKDPIAKALSLGLKAGPTMFDEVMTMEAQNEVDRMKKGLSLLDTMVTVSPLLGILGTVLGIIDSFDLLGNMEIKDPRAVTGGIAEALVSTAAGLTVAVVSLLAYNYFKAKTLKRVHIYELASHRCSLFFKGASQHAP